MPPLAKGAQMTENSFLVDGGAVGHPQLSVCIWTAPRGAVMCFSHPEAHTPPLPPSPSYQ